MSRKPKPSPPASRKPPVAPLTSPSLDKLRSLMIQVNNAGVLELPGATYRLAKFFRTSTSEVRRVALLRGVVASLTPPLLDDRPRTIANTLYALSQLARSLPDAQEAMREGGTIPYIARLVQNPHPHVQYRFLQAMAAVALGSPDNAVLFRLAGVIPNMLAQMKDTTLSWKHQSRLARCVEAIASADPESRQALLDGGALDALGRLLYKSPERCMQSTAKDAIKALGLRWNVLEGRDDIDTEPFVEMSATAKLVARRAAAGPVDVDALLGTSIMSPSLSGGSSLVKGSAALPPSDTDTDDGDTLADASVFSDRDAPVAMGGAGAEARMQAASQKWDRKQKMMAAKAHGRPTTAEGVQEMDDGFFADDY